MFAVSFRFLDLNVDVGQVLGAIGGILFPVTDDNNNNEPNEEVTEGELGKVSGYNYTCKYTDIYIYTHHIKAK